MLKIKQAPNFQMLNVNDQLKKKKKENKQKDVRKESDIYERTGMKKAIKNRATENYGCLQQWRTASFG